MKLPHLTAALSTGALLVSGCSLVEQPIAAISTPDITPSPAMSPLDNYTAALNLAWEAAVVVQKPPHPAQVWQEARVKWRQAIRLLEAIPPDSEFFVQSKEKLTIYRKNYAAIDHRLINEQEAAEHLKQAHTLAWQAAVTVQNPPHPLKVWQRASLKWQEAIALMEQIPKNTSAYNISQKKLPIYRKNYRAINQRIATENLALQTLKQFSNLTNQLNEIPHKALPGTNQVGIGYSEYTRQVQQLEIALARFASQPGARKHPVYGVFKDAIADFKVVTRLWHTSTTTRTMPSGFMTMYLTSSSPYPPRKSMPWVRNTASNPTQAIRRFPFALLPGQFGTR
jgi:hypothetical protein